VPAPTTSSKAHWPLALAPPSSPDDAAAGFVAFLQEWGPTGELLWGGHGGVWWWYRWYCSRIARCQPVPSNRFAEALGRLAPWRQASDYSTGKRRRVTIYHIPSLPDADDVAMPVLEPMRMAA